MRESITSNDALEAAIRKAGGPDTEVYNLGSMNQNFAQSLAVVDNVPDTPATVVVGINPGRFTPSRGDNQKQAEGRELLLKSDVPARVRERRVRQVQVHVHDPAGHLRRTSRATCSSTRTSSSSVELPTRTYGQHRYNLKAHPHRGAEGAHGRARGTRGARRSSARTSTTTSPCSRSCCSGPTSAASTSCCSSSPGTARSSATTSTTRGALYQPRVRRLADEYGVPYIDFNDELPLTNADFHDLSHLVEPGRVIWEARLAEELVAAARRRSGELGPAAAPSGRRGGRRRREDLLHLVPDPGRPRGAAGLLARAAPRRAGAWSSPSSSRSAPSPCCTRSSPPSPSGLIAVAWQIVELHKAEKLSGRARRRCSW